MYNEITEGDFKGAFTAIEIVNKENIDMSVWTKEQSEDLDKRFGGVNTRLDSLESDMKEVKSRLSSLEADMKEVKSRLSSLETGMKEVLRILKEK